MADYTAPSVYPYVDSPATSDPLLSADFNAVIACLLDLAATGNRVPTIEAKLATVAAGATAYTDESAQDAVAAMIAAGTQTGITATYNDAANSLSFTVAGGGGGTGPQGPPGGTGPQGPPGLVWRGTWATGTTYAISDAVAFGSSSWIAVASSVGVTPGTSGTTWALLSGQGAPQTLTYAATVTTDVSTGSYFRVTLTGNLTLANPTNPTDGQTVTWALIQDATGSRTLTLDTAFALGTTIASTTLTTTASKRDFLTAVYNSATTKWYVTNFVKGY